MHSYGPGLTLEELEELTAIDYPPRDHTQEEEARGFYLYGRLSIAQHREYTARTTTGKGTQK